MTIHTRTSGYTQETTYLHRDHLGSISEMTDEDGDQIASASMSFDAWGQRRNPETWQGSATNPAPETTDRGYTGHKMLDDVGLIHMNGRVYDPGIGRFVSADPNIPHPYNSQSYNRYTYVLNNPLSLVDPSGFQDKQKKPPVVCDPNGNCTIDPRDLPEEEQDKWKWCKEKGKACYARQNEDGTYEVRQVTSAVQTALDQVGKDDSGSSADANQDKTDNWFGKGEHEYNRLSDPVCTTSDPGCTLESSVDNLNESGVHPSQDRAFVPGKPYIADVDIFGPFGEDHISTTAVFDLKGNQIGVLNVTLSDHPLHKGEVLRIVIERRGNIYIFTHGTGSGYFGGPNIWLDDEVWGPVDNNVIQHYQ